MALPKRIINYLAEFAAAVAVNPTNNPATTLNVSPIISTSSGTARLIAARGTFTGSGAGPVGINIRVTFEPSASISEAFGVTGIANAIPPKGVTITKAMGAFFRVSTGNAEGAITTIEAFRAESPELGTQKPTNATGVRVSNQGAAGVTTSVGVDVVAQAGATTNIGVRIAKASTYTLQLTDTSGEEAGGITFGTDTALWRSAATTLRTNAKLEPGELSTKGASTFTGTVTVNTEGSPAICFLMQPTVNQAETNAQAMAIKPKFTGTGTQPAAMLVLTTSEPAASISTAYGTRNIIEANPAEGVTITTAIGAAYRFQTGATSKGSVTEGRAFNVEAPTLSGIKPTTLVGVFINNQGAAGITTSVGIDVKEQSASTTSIGIRVAKGGTYALQLSDTGGVAAGGLTFGTDTQFWRVSAKTLKTEGRIEAGEGFAGIKSTDVASAWAATVLGAKLEKVAALQEPEARTEEATGTARLRGGVKVKAGEKLVAGETVCTLPEGKRPPKLVKIPTVIGTNTAAVVSIATTGVVTLSVEAVAAVEIYLDGVTFNLT